MLEAKNLSYSVKGKDLIRNVSLQFTTGILHGILGPNGSGKTTLLKTLTGIWTPTSGCVLWQGNDLLKNERRVISKTVSFVPNNANVAFEYSVRDVVTMGRYPHGTMLKKNQQDEIIDWALDIVDASHLKDRQVCRLSSGERQRVYVARALVTESPVVLLDEPTASLDIRHQLDIWDLLRKLVDKGKIIIVSGHDLIAMERHCDRIAVMDKGCCIAEGAFAEVMHTELLQSVFGVSENEWRSNKRF